MEDYIKNGKLIEVLPSNPPIPSIIGCLYPHKKLQDPKIIYFMDHIINNCNPIFQFKD